MADNGDIYVTFPDLTLQPDGSYDFIMLGDRERLILSEGLGLVDFYFNNYSLTGTGGIGLYLGTTNYGISLNNLNITGAFDVGMEGTGLHWLHSNDVDVSNSKQAAMRVTGDNMLIRYSEITNIGDANAHQITAGINAVGSNNIIDQSYFASFHSALEAYAVAFSSYSGTGNAITNSTLNGNGSTLWTFGIWNNSSNTNVYNTYVHDWSWGYGAPGTMTVNWSTFTNDYKGNGNVTFSSDSLEFADDGFNPSPNGITYGTANSETIVGTNSADILVGNGNNDVLMGLAGADTFIFSPGTMSAAPEFNPAEDSIYLAYHYPTSVVTWDNYYKVMSVDGVPYVYMPYVVDFSLVNWHF